MREYVFNEKPRTKLFFWVFPAFGARSAIAAVEPLKRLPQKRRNLSEERAFRGAQVGRARGLLYFCAASHQIIIFYLDWIYFND